MGEQADRLAEARAKVAEAAESPAVLDARAAVLEATEDPAERDRLLRPLVPAPQTDGAWTWDWSATDTDREIPAGVLMHDETPILPVGEVGILAGLGGAGKSRLALQIAVSAAGAPDGEAAPVLHPHTVSAGWSGVSAALQVRGGPVVMAGYEDAPAWLRMRALEIARWLDSGRDGGRCRLAVDDRERLSAAVGEPPLFAPAAPGEPAAPTPAWTGLWQRVREVAAGLVVVDPVALAWDAGVEGYPAGPVGAFVAALRREAVEAACAVLLVHHTTKAPRSARREGRRLDAGDVSGSHAWVDRVRGVLVLQAPGMRPLTAEEVQQAKEAPQGDVEDYKWEPGWLGVAKANYSPAGDEVGWRVAGVDAGGIMGEHARRPVAWTEHGMGVRRGGEGQQEGRDTILR